MVAKAGNAATSQRQLSLFGYTDYRSYLGDYYKFRKDSHGGYTYRTFSKDAGFSSPNVLKLVIEGKRNIGPKTIKNFIRALGLKGTPAHYFETLVKMNHARTDADREYYYNILKKLTPQAKRRDLNAESMEFVSRWIYAVLQQMADIKDFSGDPTQLAERFHGKVGVPEISQALQFLSRQGFIEKKADGSYASTDKMIVTSDEVGSLAIRTYHRQMLAKAQEMLEVLGVEQREFGALTTILPEESLDELKFKLKRFRTELHDWASQTVAAKGGDVVVQINFQMFPHTR